MSDNDYKKLSTQELLDESKDAILAAEKLINDSMSELLKHKLGEPKEVHFETQGLANLVFEQYTPIKVTTRPFAFNVQYKSYHDRYYVCPVYGCPARVIVRNGLGSFNCYEHAHMPESYNLPVDENYVWVIEYNKPIKPPSKECEE